MPLAEVAEIRFQGRRRSGAPTELFIHESVTVDRKRTERVLLKKGCGVHLLIDEQGGAWAYGRAPEGEPDWAGDRFAHAGAHNGPSVGIEVVNPYYPKHLEDGMPWTQTIPGKWAHRGAYVVPTRAQMEQLHEVVSVLARAMNLDLGEAAAWPGESPKGFLLGKPKGEDVRQPGLWAHRHSPSTTHSDGGWPALYLWLRFRHGLDDGPAYDRAVALADGAKRNARVRP